MDALHRSAEYQELVTGSAPLVPPAPVLPVPATAHSAWRQLVGGAAPQIGVFPGSNALSRRWEPARFSRLVERLAKAGWSVAVFGGPGERALTAAVARNVALDLGGQTDLPTLAAGLAACRLLVTNDSGPMHLAAAVGTPTVSLWGAGDPGRTGPLGEHHLLLRHHELPCISCQKNYCPRRGAGSQLPEAINECLALISEQEVWEAVAVAIEWKDGRLSGRMDEWRNGRVEKLR
jgi:ADP-heptose:LPS heptosyltransferase